MNDVQHGFNTLDCSFQMKVVKAKDVTILIFLSVPGKLKAPARNKKRERYYIQSYSPVYHSADKDILHVRSAVSR